MLQTSSSVTQCLLLVYKAINGFSPSYISNLLSFYSSSYSLRSSSNKLLQAPRSNLKSYGDRRFSIAGPKLWNSLPVSLRNTDSLNSFEKHIKTYLFHQAFSWFITRSVWNFYFFLVSVVLIRFSWNCKAWYCKAPRTVIDIDAI